MLEVPQSFRAMPRWWNSSSDWLDALPGLVEAQLVRWDLTFDGQVWHGSNALVLAVRRRGLRLALRFAPPGDDVGTEAEALRFWDGRGTVQLIDLDLDARAMLLERLDATHSLADLPIWQAAHELGLLLRRQAVTAPASAPSTGELAARLAESLAARWREAGEPFPAPLCRRLVRIAEVLAEPCDELAVNADLHYAQVLAGTREPWLAVDPVLFRGDLGYALGPMLWNRLDEVSTDHLEGHIATLVSSAELDADRARDWIALRAGEYLMWGLERGLTEDPVRCRRLLTHVLP